MRTVFLAIIAMFPACVAHARIGETLDKCIERYGTPLQSSNPRDPVIFRQGPGLMLVVFERGRARQIDFQSPRPLTDKEVERLRTIAAGGTTWRRGPSNPKGPAW